MHRVLLHQADTNAIYCRPVSRCETRVAVLVRDQTNHGSMHRDQDVERKGGCQIRAVLGGKQNNSKATFLPGGDHWWPRGGTGKRDGSKHHGPASLDSQWNRTAVSTATDELGRCRPVACINCTMTGACRWGLHSRATRLFPQPRPEKCPSGFQRLVGAGYRGRG